MSTPYTHSLHADGYWHVTGPEVDYRAWNDAGDGHHAETIAGMLNLAYAVGKRDLAAEMVRQEKEKIHA